MSTPSYKEAFEPGLSTSPPNSYVVSVIRRNLEIAARESAVTPLPATATTTSSPLPSSSTSTSTCTSASPPPLMPLSPQANMDNMHLIEDLGEYLTRTSLLWAHFTENLVKGPHMEELARRLHMQSRTETGMSDMSAISLEDSGFTRLRKIRDATQQFSRDVQAIWAETPVKVESPAMPSLTSPLTDSKSLCISRPVSMSGDGDIKLFRPRKGLPDGDQLDDASPRDDASGSGDPNESDDEEFLQIDMDTLRQRGRGNYICPKGARCEKGGVDRHGNIKVFDRNSAFVQHCNKHRKPWRCDLPGCPNEVGKRRFARRDGLQRHQKSVKHDLDQKPTA